MVGRRKYDEGCAVAHALDLVGERWALLVVRELLLGPKRFTDLRAGMPGASPDVLSQRLRELTAAGVVRQAKLPPPANAPVYELTGWGAQLEPAITHLGRWGSRSRSINHEADRSIDSLVLSIRTLFDRQAAAEFTATIVLRLGEESFLITIMDGDLKLTRGDALRPTATVVTDTHTLAEMLYRGRTLDDALHTGRVTVAGKTAAIARLLRLIRLPEPAVTDD